MEYHSRLCLMEYRVENLELDTLTLPRLHECNNTDKETQESVYRINKKVVQAREASFDECGRALEHTIKDDIYMNGRCESLNVMVIECLVLSNMALCEIM